MNIVVTGVSTGIGYAIAEDLLKRGCTVFGSVRKPEEAAALQAKLGTKFFPLIFDVRDEKAVHEAAAKVAQQVGTEGIDILINNAGVAVFGPLQHLPVSEVAYQLDVNVLGVLRTTQAFLPLLGAKLPKREHPGKIINIGSVSGRVTSVFTAPYSMSKFALESMTDGLRRELMLSYGIDVISIQPGPILTPIWTKAKKETNRFQDTDYAPFLSKANDIIEQAEQRALPTSAVTNKIWEAIILAKPKTRYVIVKNAWMIKLLKYVPDRFLDNMMVKNMLAGKRY
jgi:NAD(P)-dependent dehydrogenase (short-subunit alcohol dehydrogenase family)